jgi:hypothetical protein
LLIENLRLTPAERAAKMEDVIAAAQKWRGAARRKPDKVKNSGDA